MKNMKKVAIIIAVILVVIGVTYGYINFTEQMNEPTPKEQLEAVGYVEVIPEDTIVSEEEKEAEVLYPDDLIEHKVNEAIHNMSHQKVWAKIKWEHTQITQEKVDRLLAVCKMNDYKFNELYIPILERWSKGDFSHAVEDHNVIWEMQGGEDSRNSGRAIRLLTAEEEQAYIEHNLEFDLYDR